MNMEREMDNDYIMSEERTKGAEVISKCYMLTGRAKLPGIKLYMEDLIDNDIKFIIFAHHIEVLNGIEEFI